jgi:hypothetical protein
VGKLCQPSQKATQTNHFTATMSKSSVGLSYFHEHHNFCSRISVGLRAVSIASDSEESGQQRRRRGRQQWICKGHQNSILDSQRIASGQVRDRDSSSRIEKCGLSDLPSDQDTAPLKRHKSELSVDGQLVCGQLEFRVALDPPCHVAWRGWKSNNRGAWERRFLDIHTILKPWLLIR